MDQNLMNTQAKPVRIKQSPWSRINQIIAGAHPSVAEVGDRRTASLSAWMALMVAVTNLLGAAASLLVRSSLRLTELSLFLLSVPILVGYVLSRTRWFKIAPWLVTLSLGASAYWLVAAGESTNFSNTLNAFIPLLLILGSLLLSGLGMVVLTVINLIVLGIMAALLPGFAQEGTTLIGNYMTIGFLLSAGIFFRNSIERTRLGEIRTANEALKSLQAGLEQRVADRTRDLSLAAEVGRTVALVQNLEDLLTQAVELIRQRFDLYYAQVYLVDPVGRSLVLRAGTGEAGKTLLRRSHRLPINLASINGTVAIERRPMIISDTVASLVHRANPLLPNTRSEMAVPLIAGDRLLGVLDLQAEQPGALTEENLSAFQILAGQLAVAIQNASLFREVDLAREEVELRTRRLVRSGWQEYLDGVERKEHMGFLFENETLSPLAQPLPAQVGESVLSSSIEVSGEPVGRMLFEGDHPWVEDDALMISAVAHQAGQQIENLRLLAQSERYQEEAEAVLRRLTREGWDATLAEALQPGFAYQDYEVQPLTDSTTAAPFQKFPISVRDEAIGEIAVAGESPLSPEDEDLLASIRQQLASHLENLRLARATQAALTQTEGLYAASAQVVQATSMDGVLKAVVENTSLRQFERASILLFNRPWAEAMPETGRLAAEWERSGWQPLVPVGAVFPLASVPTTRQAQRDRATFIRVTPDMPGLSAEEYAMVQQIGVNSVVVPVVAGEQWIGWLSAATNAEVELTDEDLRQINSLTGQAAAVIQSVRLLEDATARAQREQALRQITSAVRGSTDPAIILRTAVREVGRILGRTTLVRLDQSEKADQPTAAEPVL